MNDAPDRDRRAGLPSVHRVLNTPETAALIEQHGRALVLDAVRETLAGRRASGASASIEEIVAASATSLDRLARPSQRRVFNLTGTVLHTNFGRAPLPEEAVAAACEAMRAPTNLE